MTMSHPWQVLSGLVTVLAFLMPADLLPQTQVKPGFNVFTVEQDVEIGRQSATEVERQLPLLNEPSTVRYVDEIGKRLARVAPGAKYPYQFKVVNVSDINAFALPGGFMYVNRGLIEAARSEGELTGVMGHEMAHVALRHGTNQASKAYLAQAGLGVLGGVFGGGGGATTQIVEAIGGFGLNAVFLKFSRSAEEQADVVGAQMLAKAGYNPLDMASMFETLREQAGRDPGKLEQFFSSHPAPANRAERIRKETKLIGSVQKAPPVGNFEHVKAELSRMHPARSMQQIAQSSAPQTGKPPSGDNRPVDVRIERPSSRFRTFEQRNGFFGIDYPENWRPHESDRDTGVTIVPEGGVVTGENRQQSIIYGVIVNHYTPFEGDVRSGKRQARGRKYLEQATRDLIRHLIETNRHLRESGKVRRQRIERREALSTILTGPSPVTGQEEQVTLFTRELEDRHVIYVLFIAPGRDYDELENTFQRMLSSLRINDAAAHR